MFLFSHKEDGQIPEKSGIYPSIYSDFVFLLNIFYSERKLPFSIHMSDAQYSGSHQ